MLGSPDGQLEGFDVGVAVLGRGVGETVGANDVGLCVGAKDDGIAVGLFDPGRGGAEGQKLTLGNTVGLAVGLDVG